jgi:serine/threonine protein phosphatase 1
MALFAVGDVHGCARTLAALLDRIGPGRDDTVVFVGDYVDRGPDSRGTIDHLIALASHTDAVFLRGNHEALLLSSYDRTTDALVDDPETLALWYANGGEAALRSYPGRAVSPEHLAFLRATVLYHDTPDFFFVHAGLHPAHSITENLRYGTAETFLWTREHLRVPEARRAWEKPVVCGHTPHAEPISEPRLLMIDTGCVFAHRRPDLGRLCAVKLPEREFFFEPYQG